MSAEGAKPTVDALEGRLADFGIPGLHLFTLAELWRFYRVWIGSNYVTMPYPGGMVDQPSWVWEAFDTLGALEAWVRLDVPDRATADLSANDEAL